MGSNDYKDFCKCRRILQILAPGEALPEHVCDDVARESRKFIRGDQSGRLVLFQWFEEEKSSKLAEMMRQQVVDALAENDTLKKIMAEARDAYPNWNCPSGWELEYSEVEELLMSNNLPHALSSVRYARHLLTGASGEPPRPALGGLVTSVVYKRPHDDTAEVQHSIEIPSFAATQAVWKASRKTCALHADWLSKRVGVPLRSFDRTKLNARSERNQDDLESNIDLFDKGTITLTELQDRERKRKPGTDRQIADRIRKRRSRR